MADGNAIKNGDCSLWTLAVTVAITKIAVKKAEAKKITKDSLGTLRPA
jgi:hypothetical protein